MKRDAPPSNTQRTGLHLLTGDQPQGPKPKPRRLMRILENRPGRHRGLMAACSALDADRSRRPCLPPPARKPEAFRPAQPEQIAPASLSVVKQASNSAKVRG